MPAASPGGRSLTRPGCRLAGSSRFVCCVRVFWESRGVIALSGGRDTVAWPCACARPFDLPWWSSCAALGEYSCSCVREFRKLFVCSAES